MSNEQHEAQPAGWRIESGVGGFGEKGDRWICVRNLQTQCGQDFYEDRDPLMFAFLSSLPAPGTQAVAPDAAEEGEPYLPVCISSAPKHIWLDLGFNPLEEDVHFSNLGEVTWSEDNATGDGIKYARADLAASSEAQAADTPPSQEKPR